ncbi:MAG TPA: nucleotide-binding protein [Chthoniobacterales bacterium]|nr:nucleotide-binding protein [Chthoniobacterales bacterium]
MSKPRLFIGSSSESLPIVEILIEELKNDADVVPWTSKSLFPAGQTTLASLLQAASSFDFAVFLFEPDDVIQSRGSTFSVPRDNVIFELGLFMSHLGVKRAFPMAPLGRVRLLSDLGGFQPIIYEEPRDAADLKKDILEETVQRKRDALREKLKSLLQPALEGPLNELRTILTERGRNNFGIVSPEAWNVSDVSSPVRKMVRDATRGGSALVRHLALDMAEFWKTLVNNIWGSDLRNLQWRCLMIDPESVAIQEVASNSVSVHLAKVQLRNMEDFMRQNAAALSARGIRFECRLYQEPPMMHGFHVDGVGLLWSMCNIQKGRLDGDRTPYWRFEVARSTLLSCHPAESFRNWFDHLWEHGSRAPWNDEENAWPTGLA